MPGPGTTGPRPATAGMAGAETAGSELAAHQCQEHAVRALPMRPQLDGRPVAEIGDTRQAGARVEEFEVRRTPTDDAGRLGEVRRTRDVGDQSAGADQPGGGLEQLALQPDQRRDVALLPPPARFRTAPQGSESPARRVQ